VVGAGPLPRSRPEHRERADVGVEIRVENLTKRFGSQTIWEDVSLTLPAGEISVMLGPSGTGKSVFLKTLIGLLKPERGSIWIQGKDITRIPERELYEVRKLFGVLFQDGALFGSQSLYDNIAFPLREHTKKSEREIKSIVLEKMEMTGLSGAEKKLPGEISGGMRKRAGLARALVLDPEILLFDEPDSGLDPVRTAYLNQLIVDLNAEIKATFLIVTHDIATARTVPDNIGLLYRRHLAMFGPREMLLSSNEPVVRQFLNGQRQGPIGMAEEKDAGELAAEAAGGGELGKLPPIPAQLPTSDGRTRETQREPGSWLREHGVVPPPGSFEGLGLQLPQPDGSGRTGWTGETPPGGEGRSAAPTQALEAPADGPRRPVRPLRSRVTTDEVAEQDAVDEPAPVEDEAVEQPVDEAPARRPRAPRSRPAAAASPAPAPRARTTGRRAAADVLEDEPPARPAVKTVSAGRRSS
jgi:phospholipid/cholesterol/gamma-HCH transport system ATP-binding protein